MYPLDPRIYELIVSYIAESFVKLGVKPNQVPEFFVSKFDPGFFGDKDQYQYAPMQISTYREIGRYFAKKKVERFFRAES